MRAMNAVRKYVQMVACVREQSRTLPDVVWQRGRGTDNVAVMLPGASVPLVGRLGAVV